MPVVADQTQAPLLKSYPISERTAEIETQFGDTPENPGQMQAGLQL